MINLKDGSLKSQMKDAHQSAGYPILSDTDILMTILRKMKKKTR